MTRLNPKSWGQKGVVARPTGRRGGGGGQRPGNLPLLKLDGLLLAQALGNVLHNASIHAPVDSPVELRVSLNGNSLELIVRDHGPGLESGDELRVFDKFYRACNAPAGGTGLGLAIARGFLLAHRRRRDSRDHPDDGCVSRFRGKALIIEDEGQMRRLLRRVLEARDYQVCEAENGQGGLMKLPFEA